MDIFGLNHEIGALKHLLLHFQFPLDLVPKNHMVMSDVEFFFGMVLRLPKKYLFHIVELGSWDSPLLLQYDKLQGFYVGLRKTSAAFPLFLGHYPA